MRVTLHGKCVLKSLTEQENLSWISWVAPKSNDGKLNKSIRVVDLIDRRHEGNVTTEARNSMTNRQSHDSRVKSSFCSCRGPDLVPSAYIMSYKHLKLYFQTFWSPLLASMDTRQWNDEDTGQRRSPAPTIRRGCSSVSWATLNWRNTETEFVLWNALAFISRSL